MTTRITGTFRDPPGVARAVEALLDAHFDPEAIGVAAVTPEGRHPVPVRYRTRMGSGAVTGAIVGGLVGAAVASLVAAGVVTMPPMGLFASGTLLTIVQGVIAGGAAAALAGFIAGMAMWREEPDLREVAPYATSILVEVQAERPSHVEEAREALDRAGATRIVVKNGQRAGRAAAQASGPSPARGPAASSSVGAKGA